MKACLPNTAAQPPDPMSNDFHFYQPDQGHGLAHNPFKAIIGPRPIGWIASRSKAGAVNLAPYSFFNAFCDRPPVIGFCSAGWKDSVRNIEETGEFVWQLATRALAEPMNISSSDVAYGVDEFELAGLEPAPSRLVNVPRVAASPVSFECKLTSLNRLCDKDGKPLDNWLVLGEVVGVHIHQSMLKDGVYQTAAARPILRAGGMGTYAEITESAMFEMPRPPSTGERG